MVDELLRVLAPVRGWRCRNDPITTRRVFPDELHFTSIGNYEKREFCLFEKSLIHLNQIRSPLVDITNFYFDL